MEFETQSGVRYYYDNEIGIAFPSHPLMEMIRKIPLEVNDPPAGTTDKDSLFYSRFLQKLNKIRPKQGLPIREPLQSKDVKKMVLREGLLQIILSVTENCNLRCRYCVYSDVYTLSRKRSNEMMNFKTARKALDWYVSLFIEGREYNPVRKPSVCFYGGEPLLNFNLIEKCVHYLKTTYPELDFHYSITTNGTLLNKEKEDFLIEQGFFISISIDGPKEEHDRNRVYPDGSGTFNDVMKNVQRIVDRGCEKCQSICVFDWKSNLFSLDAFFRQPEIPRLSNMTNPSMQSGCLYYDQYSEEDFRNYCDLEQKAFQSYLDHPNLDPVRASFFEHLYSIFASTLLYNTPVMIMPENRVIPYSGACIIGRKIFVDVHGNFHACERINESFPTGNILTGLDFQRISEIMNDYLEHQDSCKTCTISKVCGFCYNHLAHKGVFKNASEICKDEVEVKKAEFSRAFTLGERYPHLLDTVVNEHYSWLSKVSPTLGD